MVSCKPSVKYTVKSQLRSQSLRTFITFILEVLSCDLMQTFGFVERGSRTQ